MSAPCRPRVVQVHPSLRCNLSCRHCYSSSGPRRRGELPAELLGQALADAARQGYGALSLSGGEPLLYSQLDDVLDAARAHGLYTSLTSNGMLLGAPQLARLAGRLDLLAISLDGVPAAHDRLRGQPGAFEIMRARLEGVRRSGLRFGFIFTLTRSNVDELDWIATFAVEQGAALLQIHPLENAGRARTALSGCEPDALEAGVAYLEFMRLQDRFGAALAMQLDFAHRTLLREAPERVFAGPAPTPDDALLADLVSPLVIEDDATVVPFQYGFPREFALGNLRDAPLEHLARRWISARQPAFQAHCRRVHATIVAEAGLPLVNWYDRVARVSERLAGDAAS